MHQRRMAPAGIESATDLAADLVIVRSLPWPVRRRVVELHIEGLGGFRGDEVGGPVGDQIRVVTHALDRSVVLVQVMLADRIYVREVVHRAVEIAEEGAEADARR